MAGQNRTDRASKVRRETREMGVQMGRDGVVGLVEPGTRRLGLGAVGAKLQNALSTGGPLYVLCSISIKVSRQVHT